MEAKEWFDELWRQVYKLAIAFIIVGAIAWGLFASVMYALYKGWIG